VAERRVSGRRSGPARRKPLFLAIDFGSSHVRAAVGGSAGAPVAAASRRLKYFVPEGGPDTAREFDPEAVWGLVCTCVKEAVRESGARPDQIAGIGVTGQRLGLVLFDRSGKELYGGPNTDARAVFEGAEIDASLGDAIWRATGHGPAMLLAWSKLLWFKRQAPAVFARARSVSGLADWLVYRMTGVLLMESAQGADSGMALVATGLPAAAFIEPLGLSEIYLPPSCQPGTVAGTLKSAAARQLGLREGVPVVPAGPDTQAGLAGMGVGEPGRAGVVAGWSAAAQLVTGRPVFDDTRSLWTGRHVVPKRWVLEGNAGDMGGAYEWLAGLMSDGAPSADTFARLDRLASKVEPGSRGATAYLGPSFVNMLNVGLRTGGVLFPVPLAFEPPDRGSLARAALESFAFALRYNLDRLGLVAAGVGDVTVGGGMVRTRTFREIAAATIREPVAFGPADATLRGALTLAGAGTGDGLQLSHGLAARQGEARVLAPSPAAAAEYGGLYDAWRARERRVLELEL
jgi:sugar (pentulose or hexulose) kinase